MKRAILISRCLMTWLAVVSISCGGGGSSGGIANGDTNGGTIDGGEIGSNGDGGANTGGEGDGGATPTPPTPPIPPTPSIPPVTCPGSGVIGDLSKTSTVTLSPPVDQAHQLSGQANNVDASKTKVVIYVLTNMWWVQPTVAQPFTNICSDGTWSNSTNPWDRIVVMVVDPAKYKLEPTKITDPSLEPGVLASTHFPVGPPVSLDFSGRRWGIKVSADPFDPGPNYWSNDPSVVHLADDGLHLKISMVDGKWQCGEVYLLESLGYGTYTVQVNSRLDQLDRSTVAAPLFIYDYPGKELDYEYSGSGGLVPTPNNAQFVVQPWNVSGNIFRFSQPPSAQFTVQFEWRADRVVFLTWTGWSTVPNPRDIIQKWIYTGGSIPPPGKEIVHINIWLLSNQIPIGTGNEMVISSFVFVP